MTIEKAPEIINIQETIDAATCECGKLRADCQCAKGEQCECGGDPALCHAESANTIELVVPVKTS